MHPALRLVITLVAGAAIVLPCPCDEVCAAPMGTAELAEAPKPDDGHGCCPGGDDVAAGDESRDGERAPHEREGCPHCDDDTFVTRTADHPDATPHALTSFHTPWAAPVWAIPHVIPTPTMSSADASALPPPALPPPPTGSIYLQHAVFRC